MRAAIVKYLERRINNDYTVKVRQVLISHPFAQNDELARWLTDLFKKKINGFSGYQKFEKDVTATLQQILWEGDQFYSNLFQSRGFITEQAKARESPTPYTNAARAIYSSIFLDNHTHAESLTIYGELRIWIEKELGKELAKEKSLQTFKQWLQVDEELEVEHNIIDGWMDSLPVLSLKKEKHNIIEVKNSVRLHQLARLQFGPKNNQETAKQYLISQRENKKKRSFEYIRLATKSADLLHFQPEYSLKKRMAAKLGPADFIEFVDLLKYPILQNHAFYAIQELNDYINIIALICSRSKRKTTKEHLLLIALDNYYEFLCRTLMDLNHLATYKGYMERSDEAKAAAKEAGDEYSKWMKVLIPDSFTKILESIFPKKELSNSKYFLIFFEWINSHPTLYLTHPSNDPKKEIIELLDGQFQTRLNQHRTDRHYLIDHLVVEQIDYDGLKKLCALHHEHQTDTTFREKLFNHFLEYIKSTDFRWNTEGNADVMEAINDAYYFSQVIASYPDCSGQWNTVFAQHKIHHEGWITNPSDFLQEQRESFVLAAALGMAYFKYTSGSLAEGATLLNDAVEVIIKQHRNSCGYRDAGYKIPLLFAAIIIKEFAPQIADQFAVQVIERIDSLKLFLRTINQMLDEPTIKHLNPVTKTRIGERIKREFWIIENNKTDVELRPNAEYYTDLKKQIIEKCSKSAEREHMKYAFI